MPLNACSLVIMKRVFTKQDRQLSTQLTTHCDSIHQSYASTKSLFHNLSNNFAFSKVHAQ